MTKANKAPPSTGGGRGSPRRALAAAALAACALGCGGSPSRYDPGLPATPAALRASAADGAVALSWSAAPGAAGYDVFYSTAPGAGTGGTRGPSVTATAATVSPLVNGTRYYFAVAAVNSSGASAPSAEVAATPGPPATFSQADLAGSWRFALLTAGAGAGWARGTLTVDAAGAAVVEGAGATLPYADSEGRAQPGGAGPFPMLLVDSAGHVRDAADPAAAKLDAVVGAARRDVIVGTSSSGGAASLAVLVKHDPAVTFAAGSGSGTDISGWGGGGVGGGARKVVYDQITTGAAPQEWELAAGQIGQSASIQYASAGGGVLLPYLAPSSPPRPTNKTTALAIDANGIVSEALVGPTTDTRPVFLLDHAFMSDDRTLVVGVGLAPDPSAPSGTTAAGRHALRVYHVTNVNSSATSADSATGTQADLAGTWSLRTFGAGAAPFAASGTLVVDGDGAAAVGSWSGGPGQPAPAFSLAMLSPSLDLPGVTQFWGVVVDPSDPTLHGKLSYDENLLVLTRTEPSGASSFSVAIR